MSRRIWLSLIAVGLVTCTSAMCVLCGSERASATKVFWVRLSAQEAVEFGWQATHRRYGAGGTIATYRNYLAWYHGEERHVFLVYAGGDAPLHPELRASRDLKRVWLVEREPGAETVASLDLSTGEYLSLNGVPLDWHQSLRQQEAAETRLTGQRKHPAWADSSGGVLLAVAPEAYRQ